MPNSTHAKRASIVCFASLRPRYHDVRANSDSNLLRKVFPRISDPDCAAGELLNSVSMHQLIRIKFRSQSPKKLLSSLEYISRSTPIPMASETAKAFLQIRRRERRLVGFGWTREETLFFMPCFALYQGMMRKSDLPIAA